jgi:hypothetical protein
VTGSGMSAGGELHENARSFYHEAFEFQIDVERRLVRVRFSERVTADEIASYAKELRVHPDFNPSFAEIIDLREVTGLELIASDFLRLADQADPFSREAKRAFVVQTSLQNHAARMHKILRGDLSIAIFHSPEEAENWILD